MILLSIILAELIALFFLGRSLTKALFTLGLLLFRNRQVALSLVTALLFPGTVIHELAHLFTAEVLGVHTGRLNLVPETIEGEVRTGSVAIAHSGPLRRAIIGLAPLLWGLIAFGIVAYFITQQYNNITIITILLFYLLFAISNTMFPSWEDLKGTPAVVITLALILIAGYVAGFRFSLTGQAEAVTTQVLMALVQSSGLVLAVNAILLLTINVLIVLSKKILYRNMKLR